VSRGGPAVGDVPAITGSDVVCHFGYRRHQAIRAQTITDGSITRLSRDFRTATYTVRDAVRHNDIQLLVPVRRRHCLRLCRLAVHKPGAASQIQLASLASCGCSRAASLHQRHSHLCATDAASFSQIGSRFAGQRTRHLPSLAQHSDPSVP